MDKDSKENQVASDWEVARKFGIDMAAIECNMRKTVEERIRDHSRALSMAETLKRALESARGRS